MSTVNKLTSLGTSYSLGLDEVTYNPNSGISKNILPWSTLQAPQITGGGGPWFSYCSGGDYSNIFPNTTDTPAPDGTFTALKFARDDNPGCGTPGKKGWGVLQLNTAIFQNGKTYTTSVWLKSDKPVATVYFGGNDFYAIAVQITNQWQRYSVTYTTNLAVAGNSAALDRGFEVYAATLNSTLYVWGPQTELGNIATTYEPTGVNAIPIAGPVSRTDSNGVMYVTGTLDEASFNPNSGYYKNLFQNSQSINTNYWVTQSTTLVSNTAIAPDGTKTASLVVGTSGASGRKSIYQFIGNLNTNQTYTYSVYLKSAGFNNAMIWFDTQYLSSPYNGAGNLIDLKTGNGNGATVIPVGNGWYRCIITATTTSLFPGFTNFQISLGDVNGNGTAAGDGVSGIYVWGAQLELGSTATMYVPTGAFSQPYQPIPQPSAASKLDANGNMYLAGNYDEYTGVLATTNGLVYHLDAGNPASYPGSGTTWYDISGNPISHNAIPNNTPPGLQFNRINGSFVVDGGIVNNSYQKGFYLGYNLPDVQTNTFTIEMWAMHYNFNTNGHYNNQLLQCETYQTVGFRFGIATPNFVSTDTTGGPIFWTNQSGGNFNTPVSNYPISLNTWYQVAVTYAPYTCSVYVNGSLYQTVNNATYYPPVGKNLSLAVNQDGTQAMNGEIGVFRWYNRALSASEIADNFNGLRHRYGI
jgi:hypothetical protein